MIFVILDEFWYRKNELWEIVCSPSSADFRSSTNTAMLLDLGYMTREENIREVWGQVVNPKHESV
jgi:hypothetical protein